MNWPRVAALRALQRQHQLDFVALTPGPSFTYFTALPMHLSERPILALLPAEEAPPIVIGPHFELGKLAADRAAWHTYGYRDGEPFEQAFRRMAEDHLTSRRRIGIEPTHFRALEWMLLTAAAPGVELASASELVAELRGIKDATEVDHLRAAVRCAERALEATLPHIRLGMTEREAASLLIAQLFAAGAEGMPFQPLVQSGPNAALPHATPSDRSLRAGDVLLLDFGATRNGYHSDITRTFALGEIPAVLRRAYELVQQANAAGRVAAGPGVRAEAVDAAARAVIEAGGFGAHFIHRTGHGLGLEGHEPPYIVLGNAKPLQPGMTFTIEPGIYLPGLGGVRIEDNVVITSNGCESLTTFPRELITLPL